MENKLVNYFSKITPLSTAEKNALAESAIPKFFPKGTFLLKEGQLAVDTYFVFKGCVREYILLDGEEKTCGLFTEDQWIISLNNFSNDSPKNRNLICVEDCELIVGNEAAAQLMFKSFPRFETISRIVMETVFSEQMKFMSSFLTDTPEQRYLHLMNTRPEIFQRVPQYQIASYIGVKPESLSRIRKRLLK